MPVPGPTKMHGKLGSGGSRKEGALAERHSVRLLWLPSSRFLMSLWRGGERRAQLLLIIELILVKCLQQCLVHSKHFIKRTLLAGRSSLDLWFLLEVGTKEIQFKFESKNILMSQFRRFRN